MARLESDEDLEPELMTAYPVPAPADAPRAEDRRAPLLPVLVEEGKPRYRRRVSAIVTTFNEADSIAECLDSMAWCDEILVVDSNSTDATCEIARRYDGVRVLHRPYFGAASQKNWAIDRCRHDWILILDADERVTSELRIEIENILAAPVAATAFSIKRRTYALGGEVRFSGWQHDRVIRFFRRGHARYPNRRVHADMRTLGSAKILDGVLDHHMVDTLGEYTERTRRYAFWGAAQMWRDGRRNIGSWHVLVRPAWRFFRTYVLQLGMLEGVRGLVMCGVPAYGTFLKYAMVWSWRKELENGRSPQLPEFDDDPTTWAWPTENPAERPGIF
jgi:glycosyltransferase involved in cell wall biosynthesis